MQKAQVFYNDKHLVGILSKSKDKYCFEYDDYYFVNVQMPAISLTFPKTQKKYESNQLFSFFYGLLAEGEQKDLQLNILKIPKDDHFTRLIKTAHYDTIGAITVKEIIENQ